MKNEPTTVTIAQLYLQHLLLRARLMLFLIPLSIYLSNNKTLNITQWNSATIQLIVLNVDSGNLQFKDLCRNEKTFSI